MIAVILAGGSGTRFWPLSRKDRPKQLVRLFGQRVMIAQTFERLARVVSQENVYIVCGEHLVERILDAIPELDSEHLIVEPSARNTAPAILLASAVIEARHGADVPVGIFPSDHFIGKPELFASTVEAASQVARREDAIVTLGISPTRPETGYGYILRDVEEDPDEHGSSPVDAFVEKPNVEKALEYLSHGHYFWNAGMFFFRPMTMKGEFKRQEPLFYEVYNDLVHAYEQGAFADVLPQRFEQLEKISIDYAIMEGAQEVRVVPSLFPWSDVGHWAALDEVCDANDEGNVIEAERVSLHDVKDSIFYSEEGSQRRIAAVGLDGMVVVDTRDAVLVMPKDRAQDVRAIVDMLPDDER